ncbi:MAG: methyltransferase domain-containing protein [Acidobacteriota bacterium]|jgi:SAM-dependent methyltransferase
MTALSRHREPEIMDSPRLDAARHRRALDALGRINLLSRSAAQLWTDIRSIDHRGRPLRILDLACGGGDVAIALQRRATRSGVPVEVSGCDASELAVARAQQRAAAVGAEVRFFRRDVLREPLPADLDVACSTLFLHHLDDVDAVLLLEKMVTAARRMVVVQDLERSRTGWLLAYLGVRMLSRSDVAWVDGPRSVRAAYTANEALALARRAGIEARARRCWPFRFNLVWQAS